MPETVTIRPPCGVQIAGEPRWDRGLSVWTGWLMGEGSNTNTTGHTHLPATRDLLSLINPKKKTRYRGWLGGRVVDAYTNQTCDADSIWTFSLGFQTLCSMLIATSPTHCFYFLIPQSGVKSPSLAPMFDQLPPITN